MLLFIALNGSVLAQDVPVSTQASQVNQKKILVKFLNLTDTQVQLLQNRSIIDADWSTKKYKIAEADKTFLDQSAISYRLLIPPTAPTALAATNITKTNFSANWTAPAGATKYYLDVSTNSGFTSFLPGYNYRDVGNVTTYSITGLTAGSSYYYRVRAENADGLSDDSNVISVATLPNAPSAPTANSATSITQSSFTANWGSVSGATGYRLDVSISNSFASFVSGYNDLDVGNVAGSSVTGLSASTTYYYRVRAYNTGGTSSNSNTITVATSAPPPPAPPTATSATNLLQTTFTANWNSSPGATTYYLDVATNSGFTSFVSGYNTRDVGNSTSYNVTGLTAGSTYYYRLMAENVNGTSNYSNTISVLTVPPNPTSSSATNITQTSFSAHWSAATGATGYRLDVSTSSNFSSLLTGYNNLDVGNVTTASVSGLSVNAAYYYRVRAYNASGTSSSSATISVTTSPNVPSAPTLSSPSDGATVWANVSTSFSWSAVSGATSYEIQFDSDTPLDQGNVTSFNLTSGSLGAHTWKVRAKNSSGTGAWSTSRSFTVVGVPEAPTLTAPSEAATVYANVQTAFSWSTVSNATSYEIQFDSGTPSDQGNVTSYNLTTGSLGAHTWKVRAKNGAGAGSWSTARSFTVIGAPSAPVTAAASNISQTGFTANWSTSTNATGYYLDVATDNGFTSFVSGYNNKSVGNVTTASVTGMTAATNYYYRVRASNPAGTSSSSGAIQLTTLPNPPPAPTALTATGVTQTGYTANWGSASGATGYYLDVATDNGFTSLVSGYNNKNVGNVTTTAVSGLTAGSTYYYRVRAYNTGGTSSSSGLISVSTLPNAPPAPTATAGSNITQTTFTANWISSAGATGYYLDVSTVNTFASFVSGYTNKDVGNVTSSSISALNAGTNYYYRVRAYNTGGTSSSSGTITVTTVAEVVTAPTATSMTNASQSGFTANWNVVSGAVKYYLDVATNSGFTSFVAGYNLRDVGNVTSYSIAGLSSGVTYYYRVTAENSNGVTSSPSNQITASTVPPNPVVGSASSITQNTFIANWTASTGATGYYLDVSTSNTFSTFVSGYNNKNVGAITSSSVSGLSSNTTYYYRIRAFNASGTSNSSSITSVSTLVNPPDVPLVSNATIITQTSFIANWSASTGADGYYLDVSLNSGFTSFLQNYNNKDVGNASGISITGLTANTSYYYRVRAFNSGGQSGNSTTASVTTLVAIPSAPVSSPATNVGQTGFSANWNASTGATGYYIDIAIDASFGTFVSGYTNFDAGNVVTLNVTGLNPNTTYYYRVRAYNTSGVSSSSATITAVTAMAPPVAPTALSAAGISQSGFTANWNASAGATGYTLDVSTNSSFTQLLTGYTNKDIGNSTSAAVISLSANTTYYYRVQAYNTAGSSGESNVVTVTTVENTPDPPQLNSVTAVTQGGFTANWRSSAGATSYAVQVASDNGFNQLVSGYENKDAGNATTLAITGLSGGTSYYFRTRALNSTGTPSGYSAIGTVITVPPDPVSSAASTITQTSFIANWSSSTGATGYTLDVSLSSLFATLLSNYNAKDVGKVSSAQVVGLSPNTMYYYRVRAYNTSGSSGSSSPISVTTSVAPPQSPTASVATNISQTEFTAHWNTVSGATGYYFDVAINSSFTIFLTGYNGKDVGTSTSIVLSSLIENTTYYYRVRAYNTGGTSINSNTITMVTLPAPTGAPVSKAATGITNSSFMANWDPVNGAIGYRLDVSSSSTFGTLLGGYQDRQVTSTNEVVTGISAGTQYYYRVRAVNTGGPSSNSSVISVLTLPPDPVATSPTSVSGSSFTANWNAAQSATGYLLDVSSENLFTTFESSYHDRSVSSLLEPVTTTSGRGSYFYRVRAVNASGQSGYSNVVAVSLAAKPTVNTGVAANVSQTSATLNASVNPNGLSTTLVFEYGTTLSYGKQIAADQSPISGSTLVNVTATVTGLNPTTLYHYRVTGSNSAGQSTGEDQTFTTGLGAPPVPTAKAAFNISQSGFTAVWDSSMGATSYRLDVCSNSTMTDYVLNYQDRPVMGTSEIVSGLIPGTIYYYRVRSVGPGGASTSSTTITTLTCPPEPVATSGTTITATGFKANWNASKGASGYRLDLSSNANFSPMLAGYDQKDVGNVTAFTVTGTTVGVSYYYRVWAVNASGRSQSSNIVSVYVVAAPTVSTQQVSDLKQTTARLNGSVIPNGSETTAYFRYGVDSTLVTSLLTKWEKCSFGSSSVPVSADVSGLSPRTRYYGQLIAFNSIDTSRGTIYSFTTLTNPPGIVSLSSPADRAANQALKPELSWAIEQSATRYLLHVSNSATFTSMLLSDTVNSPPKVIGPLEYSTTYYWRVQAINSAGGGPSSTIQSFSTVPPPPTTVAASANVSFPTKNRPADYTAADYRLVGLPGASDLPLSSVLTGTHKSDWQAYWDNGAATNYLVEYDASAAFQFTVGKAFWLISKAPITISKSYNAAPLNADQEVEISLRSGWNLITNPFASSIPWSSIVKANNDTNSSRIQKFENGSFTTATQFEPYVGYYYYNERSLPKLRVPYTSVFAKQEAGSQAEALDWNVVVTVRSQGFITGGTIFGTARGASEGFDGFDERRPRTVSELPGAIFERPEWDPVYPTFGADIRKSIASADHWDLSVQSNKDAPVGLEFSGIRNIPERFSVYLIDREGAMTQDLRKDSMYTFLGRASATRFTVLVGYQDQIETDLDGAVPKEFALHQNYPNPFNPNTSVKVSVPTPAWVQIELYTIVGQKVRTLFAGLLQPGRYTYEWNGRSERGVAVASGVYLCRMQIDQSKYFSIKMTLVK